MNSVKKYGNVAVGTRIGFPNSISSTITVASNEITLSDLGNTEQVSLEIKFTVTFDGSDIFRSVPNIQINQVYAVIILAIILVALAYGSSLVGLAALLLFIVKPK